MKEYLPRIIDKLVDRKLKLYGAVSLEGCKWCGKSTTCKQFSKSEILFQDPDEFENYRAIASTKPSLLLEGEKPRLIDEWQEFPQIWDSVRYDVDRTGENGQYLLTGSATVFQNAEANKSKPKHSGTGRIVNLKMRPMSLYESKESTGEVSLSDLFEGKTDIKGISRNELEDYAYFIARGGWPKSLEVPKELSTDYAKDYIDSVAMINIRTVDEVDRDPLKVKKVLKSLARNNAQIANLTTLREDIRLSRDDISEKTIADYINAFDNLYLTDNVEAWNPKIRSKAAIRSSEKRCLVDPSLAMAALGASDKDLLKDFNTFGFMFESLCIRDLKVYSEVLNGNVFYYRDSNNLECDAIVHLDNGKWGAIEIKLGGNDAEEAAAKSLLKLVDNIDVEEMNKPSFLMILTATKYAYKREDGVLVVPLGCLKD